MAGGLPLHGLNPTGRFSDRADDYVRFRPNYPQGAFDAILQGLPEPGTLTAADVGAGTGISARQLAARGVRVIAIEPNAAMARAAESHPNVVWRDGTAEATGLAPGSVHLVLVAQAFHWFRHAKALAEFHRVLRPGGRLAVMWNARDRADPLTRGYIAAIRAVDGEDPCEVRAFDPDVLHQGGWFAPATLETFPNVQRLDRAGLLGRATSASYVPREGPGFEALRRLLDELFERHRDPDGMVTIRYGTKVFLSQATPQSAG
jgi:SAM-dependent methyltransferase